MPSKPTFPMVKLKPSYVLLAMSGALGRAALSRILRLLRDTEAGLIRFTEPPATYSSLYYRHRRAELLGLRVYQITDKT